MRILTLCLSVLAVVLCERIPAAETARKLEELKQLESELPPKVPDTSEPAVLSEPVRPTPPKSAPPPPPPSRRSGKSDLLEEGPASGRMGGELGVKWLSEYFFRGVRFSRNDVLQQRVSLWYEGFKLSGFFNYDFGPDEFNEADGTVSYSFPVSDDAVVEAGYTYYGYPHREFRDTQEFFAGIRQDLYVDVGVYGYYDFDEGTGCLWEFSLGKDYPYGIIDPFARFTAVLNGRYFNDDIEFSHGLISVGLPVRIGEHIVVSGEFNYQWGWQGWVEDEWFAGAGVTLKF